LLESVQALRKATPAQLEWAHSFLFLLKIMAKLLRVSGSL